VRDYRSRQTWPAAPITITAVRMTVAALAIEAKPVIWMVNDTHKRCPHCFGSGWSPVMRRPRPGRIEPTPCAYCGGTGHGQPLGVRIFRWISMAAWAIGLISLFLLAGVETAALRHPTEPTDVYSVPIKVKCCIHYVTPDQGFYDRLAFIGFVGGLLASLVFMKGGDWLQSRQKGPPQNPQH
jgi:hypothetical protein